MHVPWPVAGRAAPTVNAVQEARVTGARATLVATVFAINPVDMSAVVAWAIIPSGKALRPADDEATDRFPQRDNVRETCVPPGNANSRLVRRRAWLPVRRHVLLDW